MNEKKWAYAAGHTQELEALVRTLARIPAPTGQEDRRAEFCLNWLKEKGAQSAYMDAAGNVIYRYGGAQKNGEGEASEVYARPLIIFDAHMDVVFPDTDELPLEERDGRIYCPGVGDDTANLAVLLMMARYAAQHQPDTGGRELLFVCGVGEEGLGNLKGARAVCEAFGDRIEAFYALDLTSDSYLCRAVGSLRYRVTVTARGGHSYHCFGNTNANVVLAELITELYRIQPPQYGTTTYNVGLISGGTSVNTIAQRAELLYEIRSDDVRGLEAMRASFYSLIERYRAALPEDCALAFELIGERPCEAAVDDEKCRALFENVETAVAAVRGRKPVPAPFSTDCNIPLSLGIPAVCVGTYRGAGAHTREEYIEKDSLSEGLAIGLRLLGHYLGG